MKLLTVLGLTTIVLTILLALLIRLYDYNKFIQIPFWTLFSMCYLTLDDGNLSVCTPEFMSKLEDWTISKWNWDLETSKPNEDLHIPEMSAEEFSYDKLDKLSNGFTVPVVVRGLFKKSNAYSKWTANYFQSRYGDNILIILGEGRPEQQYELANSVTSGTTGSGSGYQKIMQPFKMKLGNALSRMEKGEKLYLSNVDTIFRRNNDLIDDMNFSTTVTPWAYDPYMPYAAQIFLGYGSKNVSDTTGTMMHCAASANLFVQAQGSKHWTFVSPRYTIMLRPRLGRFTPAATVGKRPVDVPKRSVMLNQGDMLFNPPWQWHEIRNQEGFNVGVATRENHPVWILRNNWIFSSLLEVRATPRVAKNMIPVEKKALRLLASIPFLSFYLVYFKESLTGPGASPLFTAAFNPCDEHDPNGCTTTILDKTVYSDDVASIPYRE